MLTGAAVAVLALKMPNVNVPLILHMACLALLKARIRRTALGMPSPPLAPTSSFGCGPFPHVQSDEGATLTATSAPTLQEYLSFDEQPGLDTTFLPTPLDPATSKTISQASATTLSKLHSSLSIRSTYNRPARSQAKQQVNSTRATLPIWASATRVAFGSNMPNRRGRESMPRQSSQSRHRLSQSSSLSRSPSFARPSTQSYQHIDALKQEIQALQNQIDSTSRDASAAMRVGQPSVVLNLQVQTVQLTGLLEDRIAQLRRVHSTLDEEQSKSVCSL